MKQQIFLHIPEPCHENWDSMTPEGRGRFCASCAKTVVDFTAMTDAQVLNYLKTIKGNTCGRFKDDQLERAMLEEEKKKKNRWQWIMAALTTLLWAHKVSAQSVTVNPKPIPAEQKQDEPVMMLGKIAPRRIMPEEKKEVTIKGLVKDIEGMPLQNATITIDGSAHINTDEYGEFALTKPKIRSRSTLEVSYVGNKTEKITVNYADENKLLVITLTPENTRLQDVVVQSSANIVKGGIVAGGISVAKNISKTDTLLADCKKSIGLSNVYPNPASKNSRVNIKTQNAGDYDIQMFSGIGTLVNQQLIKNVVEKQTLLFTIPANIAAGNYYIRIINNTTKKQSTEKIIVL